MGIHLEYFDGLLSGERIGSPCDCSVGSDHDFGVHGQGMDRVARTSAEWISSAMASWSERTAMRHAATASLGVPRGHVQLAS